MKITVWCTTSFEGFHCWPDAPAEVDFLRVRHRHIFHVKASKQVFHDDRDVEFILLKRSVDRAISDLKKGDVENWSCERWAVELINRVGLTSCEVSEDGENGALVET